MNWGYKIIIILGSFITLMVTLVTICMRQDSNFLVSEKYYEKEIAYQDQIDIQENTAALMEKPGITYLKENQVVTFRYPDHFNEEVSGSILFFRPSDASKDFTIPLKKGSQNKQSISVANLEKGFWKIKMEWSSANKKYYLEERLVVL